ncbi:RNA 3'-terminal phosphate cyclase [Leptolyngbya sp. FACHB-261]|uniref:RNA 3'-terminal phosphate cyclase n=1 Tax=Leptolyngbya sp. FACHB-261 TaxID=2692806 RepID=UPI0016881BC9|nr:RNA 3'-terminal phosphate cyclase [Leptolyngbya sp. FACHB-261]MBD2100293.1 RNA 3'-phosphate cyclase [Leptolyngbya sp. FACHB-261]
MAKPLVIDGSHGEGGGQILRTSLSLSAISGQPIRIENARAGRGNPGLAAQHLTTVRAVAALCAAKVEGDHLGSQTIKFEPQKLPQPGHYCFDVMEARQGGSAGAVTPIVQTVLLPLALAAGASTVAVRGGTHIAWSPPFDYARQVWLPMLEQIGVQATLELHQTGWYPVGQGEVQATIQGLGPHWQQQLSPLTLYERGKLQAVEGQALAANLPAHIPQRMVDRARTLLAEAGLPAQLVPKRLRAACPGTGLFLTAKYEHSYAGFSSMGAIGKASELVAEEAISTLLAHYHSGAALEEHLADQLLLPLALVDGQSQFSVERISRHLTTNAWVLEQFGLAHVQISSSEGQSGTVTLQGQKF